MPVAFDLAALSACGHVQLYFRKFTRLRWEFIRAPVEPEGDLVGG